MKILVSHDPFDTEMLKLNCFKIYISDSADIRNLSDLTEAVNKLSQAEAIFLFTEYSSRLIAQIQDLGFTLIGTQNVYAKRLDGILGKTSVGLETARKDEIRHHFAPESFSGLVLTLVTRSRYWKDAKISKDRAIKLYERWFHNSIYSDYADEVVIALKDKKIVGFISLRKRGIVGYIDLVVVDEIAKGSGIGKLLVEEASSYFASHHVESIKVETEGENIEANRFYQKLGFLLDTHSLVFHKHLTN